MANLPENDTFDSVYQLEQEDPVDAGVDGAGVANRQAQELTNRTRYLRNIVDTLQTQIGNILTELSTIEAELDNLVIGTDIQAFDQNLQEISDLNVLPDRYLATDGSGVFSLISLPIDAVVLRDEKSTFAGTGIIGWNKRDLNTKLGTGSYVNLFADSTFTISPGKYLIFASVPATMVDAHIARLYNNSTSIGINSSSTQTVTAASISGQSLTTYTHLICVIDVLTSTNYQIDHYIKDTIVNRSLGAETGVGGTQVYTQVAIVKLE